MSDGEGGMGVRRNRWYYVALGFLCGFTFVIGCGGGGSSIGGVPAGAQDANSASNIIYGNSASGLAATNVQAAIDEICAGYELRIAALEAKLAHVTVGTDANNKPAITVSGANLYVNNDTGFTTGHANGTGNIIVGYNEERGGGGNVRTGSHNIVVGKQNNYTSCVGLNVGLSNELGATWGTVLGAYNAVTNTGASVTGGMYNTASGQNSSVSGGLETTASGDYSSVAGGFQSTASAPNSFVAGGYRNRANGWFSSAVGGRENYTEGTHALVTPHNP